MARRDDDRREKVLLSIGCVVAAVWSIAMLVQVAFPSHVVPTEVHGIMFLVTTFFFGGAVRDARKNMRDDNGNGDK